MANDQKPDISALFDEGTAIQEAMNAAARDAILEHKQRGLPLAMWRDGKVAWVAPEDVDIGPEEAIPIPPRESEKGRS